MQNKPSLADRIRLQRTEHDRRFVIGCLVVFLWIVSVYITGQLLAAYYLGRILTGGTAG